MNWEIVIGLEIHVQLSTQSKLFSASAHRWGAAQNSQASAIDLGMPGTLPLLNEAVVAKAIRFGLAIDAELPETHVFARKNYFYPDLSKGYQISQFSHPVVGKGAITIDLADGKTKSIGITRAHLEEDAGKLVHDTIAGASAVDFNRAGTPLLEIVTDPDLRSAAEAGITLRAINTLVRYLDISDGDLSRGSMRCDANVSVRRHGETILATRTELKNINSYRFVERAIVVEANRQIQLLEQGENIVQETRLFDPIRDITKAMRSKEEANDYRYFPDPDLLPIPLTDAYVSAIRAQMNELPRVKARRYCREFRMSLADALTITAAPEIAAYFEAVVAHSTQPQLSASWVIAEILGLMNKHSLASIDIASIPIRPAVLGQLIIRIADATISGKIAKELLSQFWQQPVADAAAVDAFIDEQGYRQVSDPAVIATIVDAVVAAYQPQVAQYQAADAKKQKKLIGFFVGQVMQQSRGKANPSTVNQMLVAKLQ